MTFKRLATDEDLFTSLANRLIRLNTQLTPDEKGGFKDLADGKTIQQVVKGLLDAYDPDMVEARTQALIAATPIEDRTPAQYEACEQQAQAQLCEAAGRVFNGELNEYIEKVRQVHEQIIDHKARTVGK